jgi:hypothetical protein
MLCAGVWRMRDTRQFAGLRPAPASEDLKEILSAV